MKRRFVTFVSHQLQMPLVAIHQYLDVLRQMDNLNCDEARRPEWLERCIVRTDFVESLSCFLEMNHLHLLKAHNGEDGLKIARFAHPDVILIDVIMGERTEGFFTIQEIRRVNELKRTPIFVLSSLYSQIPEFGITLESSWLAHDDFLPKPVDMDQLLEKIQSRTGVTA